MNCVISASNGVISCRYGSDPARFWNRLPWSVLHWTVSGVILSAIVNFRRYIPDHAVTTVPVLALMVAVHFFLLRDDPLQPGIEATSDAPGYYQHWQRPAEQTEFDIDAEMARLELDDSAARSADSRFIAST